MKKSTFLLLALSLFLGVQLQMQAQSFAEFDRYLSTEVAAGRLVGVHGMVFQEGKLVYDHTYGLRDKETSAGMQGNELYFIQSIPIIIKRRSKAT